MLGGSGNYRDGVQGVASSNPAVPTNKTNEINKLAAVGSDELLPVSRSRGNNWQSSCQPVSLGGSRFKRVVLDARRIECTSPKRCPQLGNSHHQRHRLKRRGVQAQLQVERLRFFGDRVHEHAANADGAGRHHGGPIYETRWRKSSGTRAPASASVH